MEEALENLKEMASGKENSAQKQMARIFI